ncbi:hypothetical protein LNKW23_17110 [Paralimibaculum aggregatum]|uniref:Secreted protein n=1 Tax=Paralimibaculum aggregatum TaxID=3036245 RepID=A0ABQ6LMS5_9RHOB|nr:VPLPA-CTERM sorting domain-containing protein [Limibaculum sp. NKW23]GMG82498.1 hypothetical protein LNKW23_17110 [Limibaculum sp. NKW23]
MNTRLLSIIAAAGIAVSTSANALFVDLTDTSLFPAGPVGGPVATSVGGVTVTVTSSPNTLNFNDIIASPGTSAFCTAGGGSFACDSDGAGIGGPNPDEINGDEVLTITFSEAVEITAFYLLDFFFDEDDEESAEISYDSGPSDVVDATEVFVQFGNGFFASTGLSRITSTVTFVALDSNDLQGVGDFAVAGLEFNLIEREIPVPAALPLMLTGLAGLALYRRRRAA